MVSHGVINERIQGLQSIANGFDLSLFKKLSLISELVLFSFDLFSARF